MKKLGYSNRDAAIKGTGQVAGAIFASTITTISVFVPVLFIEGFIKEIFLEMALTIAYSLIASLLIALTLVPAISSKILREDEVTISSTDHNASWAKRGYEKLFNLAFRFKYVVLGLVVILFGGFIALAMTNGFEYFPASDEGQLTISISNPVEDSLSTTEFFSALDDLTEDILLIDDVEVVGITLGSMQGSFLGFSSSNAASASVVLKDDRNLSTTEVESLLNALLLDNYSLIEFEITGSQQQTSMLTGSGYQVELRGYDLDILKLEAIAIADLLASVEGVAEVDNGVGIPADEIKITIDKNKAVEYGYLTALVAVQIMESLASEEVVTSITQGGSLYDIYLHDSSSNTDDTSYSIESIKNMVLGQAFTGYSNR
jgi:HAE1 family hydrophobic/amphiphilic exporter-1